MESRMTKVWGKEMEFREGHWGWGEEKPCEA